MRNTEETNEGGSKTNNQLATILQAIQDQGTLLEKHIREARAEVIAIREDYVAVTKIVNIRFNIIEERLNIRLNAMKTRIDSFTIAFNKRLVSLTNLFT